MGVWVSLDGDPSRATFWRAVITPCCDTAPPPDRKLPGRLSTCETRPRGEELLGNARGQGPIAGTEAKRLGYLISLVAPNSAQREVRQQVGDSDTDLRTRRMQRLLRHANIWPLLDQLHRKIAW